MSYSKNDFTFSFEIDSLCKLPQFSDRNNLIIKKMKMLLLRFKNGSSLYSYKNPLSCAQSFSKDPSLVCLGYTISSMLEELEKFPKMYTDLLKKAVELEGCNAPICHEFIKLWSSIENGVTLFMTDCDRPMPPHLDSHDLREKFEMELLGYDWAESEINPLVVAYAKYAKFIKAHEESYVMA